MAADLSYLLDRFGRTVADVRSSIVLSADGLLLARSSNLDQAAADQLAAVAAALNGLARGASRQHGWGLGRKTIMEMEHAYFFVSALGPDASACLAVCADINADVGQIAYEMAVLAGQAGAFFAPGLRPSPALTA
ncbi:roadblock/LC7 domain-containing protein [Dactylosporangium sp. NPDC005572]|uniref:roadblock/LC7 domain-containing protein n=1 Tax=Dactylosporangium sp. NPDC005572 TaxID=3156889 RepID=UPI0033B00AF0